MGLYNVIEKENFEHQRRYFKMAEKEVDGNIEKLIIKLSNLIVRKEGLKEANKQIAEISDCKNCKFFLVCEKYCRRLPTVFFDYISDSDNSSAMHTTANKETKNLLFEPKDYLNNIINYYYKKNIALMGSVENIEKAMKKLNFDEDVLKMEKKKIRDIRKILLIREKIDQPEYEDYKKIEYLKNLYKGGE